MDHPTLERIERTGYPFNVKSIEFGVDALQNEIYAGDKILTFEDEVFLVEALTLESKEILEIIGAEYRIVK